MSAQLQSSPRIIVLVGLMGAGKTTLGRLLARHYAIPFIDSDTEIERAAGCSVAELFSRHGETHFREGEHRVIRRLLQNGSCVIATGGGAWMDIRTRHAVQETQGTCTVWLRVPLPVLLQRLRRSPTQRPLLTQDDPAEALHHLAMQRHPVYAEADITIDCGEESVTHGATLVRKALEKQYKKTQYESQMPAASSLSVPVHLAQHHYVIQIGSGLLSNASTTLIPHLRTPRAIIITDDTVKALHLPPLHETLRQQNVQSDVFSIPPGEHSKSLGQYSTLMEDMLARGVDRDTTIIALGGGVVGDLAGFVAATALRGLPFIQIPTTLLAQVDSSVGGKTGINAQAGKNLIGAFWQPDLVLADTDVLATLPRRQRIAGYAEIVKSGLIADSDLFAWCERHGAGVLEGDPVLLGEAVQQVCRFKARIVCEDERESAVEGGRALLNLGHTFAHALEAEYLYDGRLLHGEAVSIGLHLALALSVAMGLAPEADLSRLDHHLHSLGMPTGCDALPTTPKVETLIGHMMHDKKRRNGRITFVLLHGIGRAFTCRTVSLEQVRALLLREGYAA